ncbi:DUF6449 domain-containing protein [Tepidibacter hydrothermalis]|uniref:DUF6449 domain-containing protein n=1 Tax=Tepidibacter hydrothermalis TaxID=3036126 RepID=A0ABY8EK29_9FIRM|nr:DUF6449 domain-containing protein [Tepidibacter hydrothermalis]WFD11490.1 DUF6449 domain-containing protein [Tepidibacter hydrothermalis]
MKSKISLFNKGVILNDLKRFSWIGVVYLLGLLLTIPMRMMMVNSEVENYGHYGANPIKRIFDFEIGETMILMGVIPVILAILLFRYMHVKKSTDMIHSLPIKRGNLYNNHIFVGTVLLILPVIVTTIACIILNSTSNYNDYYKEVLYTIDILRWGGITIILSILIFMFTVLVGMITGISAVQGVLSYIFLFLPVGLTGLVVYNMAIYIYGFSAESYLIDDLFKLSPLTIAPCVPNKDLMSFKAIIIYIIICIILYIISRVLYNKRNLEAASQSIAFKSFKPIFKYGVTFCSMLLGGFYFQASGESLHWVLFGYFIMSLIGYFIAEIIIKKSLRVFKNVKGYLIYVAVIIILLLGMKFDIIGYEKYVPQLEKVETIYFDRGFYRLTQDEENRFYNDEDNCKNIQQLHKEIINNKEKNLKSKNSNESISIAYKLKNGKEIRRRYFVQKEDYIKYLKPIYESKEYKEMHNRIFDVNDSDIEKITIRPVENSNKVTYITDKEEIRECLEILKDEINNQKYEDMIDKKAAWADIDISLVENKKDDNEDGIEDKYDNNINLRWDKSFVKFEKWLEEKDYIKNSRITSEEVAYATVEKNENPDDIHIDQYGRYINQNEKKVKRLDILDKDKIEVCLRNYENDYYRSNSNAKYIIGFYSEDKNNIVYGSFEEESAPDFIKDFFK